MSENLEDASQQDLLDAVHGAIASEDAGAIRQLLQSMHPAEVADLLESIPSGDRERLWQFVEMEREGDVLAYAQDSVRSQILEIMPPEEVAAVTAELDLDDVADILQDLPEAVADEVLRRMDAADRDRVNAVLQFPEDSAGGLMNTDAVTVRPDVHLDVVLRYLRLQHDLPERTDNLFVVDRDNRYQGLLPLTDLLTSELNLEVAAVMSTELDPLPAMTPATDVALLFEQRDLVSAPVVDAGGQLLGRVTVDDVVDVIREQGDQSLRSLAGLSQEEDEDTFAPVLGSARRRAVWLAVNLATSFLAAYVIGKFEATIQELVALAVLMPVVASMGGIGGTQTLTIVIRGLALGQLNRSNSQALLYRELAVAAINGVLWAAVVGVVAYLWFQSAGLGLVIGFALLANLLTGALSGTFIPLILNRLNIDPALAGGVVLTTVTDVVGFVCFLGLATVFLLH